MTASNNLLVAKNDFEIFINTRMANRHGLIAGSTGTGKTVTLQTIAEKFSEAGVPVFMADIKGDLSGAANQGGANPKIDEKIRSLNLSGFSYKKNPVIFWDVFGQSGHPVRTTISEMGPLLLSRLLDLNETQSGVLNAIFKIADDSGLLLLDLKDLRVMLEYAAKNSAKFTAEYGNISTASVGAIQRGLLQLEQQGAENFFGEPALDIMNFVRTDGNGNGVINILAADKLMLSPKLYSTFLLWLLSELFEKLPEAGDLDRPKLVFFFDEAHLLFNESPKILLDKIEQVVRLIRSKGVGVFFVTQNPLDIPDTVFSQLGNRVQHALRAFTPRDQKAVKSAAETFRQNPKLDTAAVITEMGVGEALVSFLDEKGIPGIVQRCFVIPPGSQIGPITSDERKANIRTSEFSGIYEKTIDRVSAYEKLKERNTGMLSENEKSVTKEKSKNNTGDKILKEILSPNGIGTTTIVRGLLGSLLKGGKRYF